MAVFHAHYTSPRPSRNGRYRFHLLTAVALLTCVDGKWLSNGKIKVLEAEEATPESPGFTKSSLLNTKESAPFGGPDTQKTCVIGAGPSGLWAAYNLQLRGYDVVVLDKSDQAGGRVRDIKSPNNNTISQGAIFINPAVASDPTNPVAQVLSMTGLSGLLRPAFDISITGTAFNFMDTLGENPSRLLNPYPDLFDLAALNSESIAYVSLYFSFLSFVGGPTIPAAPIPADLQLPTLDFLRKNGLLGLVPYLQSVFTSFGYGRLETTPMLYTFRNISPALFLQVPLILEGGMAQAFKSFAASQINDLRLNVEIVMVIRLKMGGSYIIYEQEGASRLLHCNELVTAFPQRLEDMAFLLLDDIEKTIFKEVKTVPYSFHAVTIFPGLPHNTGLYPNGTLVTWNYRSPSSFDRGNTAGNTNTRPLDLKYGRGIANLGAVYNIRENQFGDDCAFWSSDPFSDGVSQEEFEEEIRREIAFLDSSLNATFILDAFRSYPQYFPHVDSQSLNDSFYSRLKDLQGHKSTFHVGGLLNFDWVEGSMRAAQAVVEEFFPVLTSSPTTFSPITSAPTNSPTTIHPSTSPSTANPSRSPSSSPSSSPTTIQPSGSPSYSPATMNPSGSPSTSPSSSPTASPITVSPSSTSPLTVVPTRSPSAEPSSSPLTVSSTSDPTTIAPSPSPLTISPVTGSPLTSSPITISPTSDPTTIAPSPSPLTISPVTGSPLTSSPITVSPTNRPSTEDDDDHY